MWVSMFASEVFPAFRGSPFHQAYEKALGSNAIVVGQKGQDLLFTSLSLGAWVNYGNRPLTIFDANCPSAVNDEGCTVGAVRSRPIEHLGWVALAGLLGFLGNEWVALYRIRVKGEFVTNESGRIFSVDAITQAANTNKIGDGKIFVLDLERALRIRTGEENAAAIAG